MSLLSAGRAIARGKARPRVGLRWAMMAIIAAYAVLGVVWSFAVPLGEGPDEGAHMAYVRWLAAEGRLPVQNADHDTSDVPGEGHQPPLAYLLMVPAVAWLPSEAVHTPPGNPDFRWNGGTERNAYLHGVVEQPPYRGAILAWHLARLVSVALGAISVGLCAATARLLWPDFAWIGVGAAAIVAFNPQWLFQHALVSNDPLTIALGCTLVFLCVRRVQRPDPTWRTALAMGAALGLLLATKQSALALVPLPFAALLLASGGARRWRDAAVVVVTVLAISAWWYVRNTLLYGDPLGLQAFQEAFATGDFAYGTWQGWRDGGWNLLRSSWGSFGWLTLPLPDGAFAMVRVILLVGCAGLLASIGGAFWRGRGKGVTLLLLALGAVVAWTVAFAFTAGSVAWQGRFLFPAAPAIGILLAAGLAHALPRRSALVLFPTVCLVLGMVLPWSLIAPSYATPALRADQVPHGNTYARFDWGWKRAFELQDVQFAPEVRSGDTLRVDLTWHLAEQVDRPWSVFVHVVDDEETIVAERNAEPLDGDYPTDTWAVGDWYRDTQPVSLADVAPGTYHVRIGMWNPEDGERLGVYDRQGTLRGDLIEAGEVVITADQP